jgi:CRISPR-associated endonuclease Csy4
MNYYIELTLIDNPDFTIYELWSKLYRQLHLTFVEHKDERELISYGMSFPQYRFNSAKNVGFLGAKLRIFASKEQLEALHLTEVLNSLIDYVHITGVREVPQDKITGFACYYRARPKDSVEQRILHQAKRRQISIQEATEHFKGYVQHSLDLPFIGLKSSSSLMRFKLLIGKAISDHERIGKFGSYGLSNSSTVPEF